MSYKYLIYEKNDGLARIKMNRPDKLNAINPDVFDELENVLIDCEKDSGIKVVIVTGDKKAFGAGADLEPMIGGDIARAYELTDQSQRILKRLDGIPKPTIAAVAGYALGGGFEMALCCDFRIAADNAVFALPEINLGLIPGAGGTQRLAKLIGLARATEIIFLGKNIDAVQAEKWGVVSSVVPVDQLEDECEKLAHRLMRKSSIALRAAKVSLRSGLNVGLQEGLKIEQDAFCMLFGTEDQKEGLASFLEKRKPVFTGR